MSAVGGLVGGQQAWVGGYLALPSTGAAAAAMLVYMPEPTSMCFARTAPVSLSHTRMVESLEAVTNLRGPRRVGQFHTLPPSRCTARGCYKLRDSEAVAGKYRQPTTSWSWPLYSRTIVHVRLSHSCRSQQRVLHGLRLRLRFGGGSESLGRLCLWFTFVSHPTPLKPLHDVRM